MVRLFSDIQYYLKLASDVWHMTLYKDNRKIHQASKEKRSQTDFNKHVDHLTRLYIQSKI